ncbi:acetyl-CoA carboxylase carboxyltransferase subunit alpha [Actinomadura rupiterrae]|uniref:acetyl-CoA carboxylase carboxyltransferase subunit alpha n=1 Tax=Actinomadura rupiterrae TaxID=559627 RepID=UPI0020A36E1C|nr:acetyl-CoA carboxylase carboxyltransferase subunit alpha [Actinomadura rupiterrae]MCP2341088.1 acetyl-CoA carboxylase carboxyl transferase subunit beta [Actinomadura rupiterrae]
MTTAPVESAATEPDWLRCSSCKEFVFRARYVRELSVCPSCGAHGRLDSAARARQLLDPGSVEPLPAPDVPDDPLGFATARAAYAAELARARRSGVDEAVVCVRGAVRGRPVIAAIMDFRFFGGSMGAAAGERLTGAMETALRERTPLLLVTASGGARMQEGALSLMQMAKTSQAMAELDEAGVLTVTLVTDPTYGGVAASFASLSDVVIAEPGARMGFAGPRVIEQTIRQRLPEGFQTAEFLLAEGLVDGVVPRQLLRSALARVLAAHDAGRSGPSAAAHAELLRDPDALSGRDPWEAVGLARHVDRPTTLDYVAYFLEDFLELHGDRMTADCPAIVGGIGLLAGRPVMLIGHEKGHSTRDRTVRNFGMATPAGYRKSARLMRLAAKLGLPVVTLIDTPGAYPGLEAERDGQSIAIADNLRLMSGLPVPVVAVVTGEGGSGGALALGVADRVLALRNAVYSVISPEGCAAILWKDAAAAPEAAAALRMHAGELLRQGIVDAVVPEPEGGAHTDPAHAATLLRNALLTTLEALQDQDPVDLIQTRRARFRRYGL